MKSASKGGHGKADIVKEVTQILYYKSVLNLDKGEGSKIQKFADVINGSSLTKTPGRPRTHNGVADVVVLEVDPQTTE